MSQKLLVSALECKLRGASFEGIAILTTLSHKSSHFEAKVVKMVCGCLDARRNLLSNALTKSFWDALGLGIEPFLCFTWKMA